MYSKEETTVVLVGTYATRSGTYSLENKLQNKLATRIIKHTLEKTLDRAITHKEDNMKQNDRSKKNLKVKS